jgi:hypothetical protein
MTLIAASQQNGILPCGPIWSTLNFHNLAGDRLYHPTDMVGADAGYSSVVRIWPDYYVARDTI